MFYARKTGFEWGWNEIAFYASAASTKESITQYRENLAGVLVAHNELQFVEISKIFKSS
jgi:hypothetical protein